ncbi:MAG: FtsW/RodA/SpoVE family cell cycle protein [Lachnospiraceae bacterium]|nr:FtsW/RodA/SpoVE family cell cycle protein [Lachnospiraceae bacterium]
MINLITQASKYAVIILMAVYTVRSFTVFFAKTGRTTTGSFVFQTLLMLAIHFLMNLVVIINVRTVESAVFYAAQLAFFIVFLVIYSNIYKNASRLLIENMFFLMMVGFVYISRLDMELAIKQFGIAVGAVILSLFVPAIIEKASFLKRIGPVYGILGILLVGSVFVFGSTVYGATNWISIGGIGFQPSEIAKIVFVFFIAAMLYKEPDLKRIIITTAAAAVFVLILVVETDLGAAVIFFITYLAMLYIATGSFKWSGAGLGLGAVAAVAAWRIFSHVQRRVTAWLDPWSNYEDAGYQIAQSLFAIGTGGWFGLGLFQGMPKIIPVVQSDFIFSAIWEECGGIFAVCLVLIYISCFLMFFNISLQITNVFYKLLAAGLSIALSVQTFLCIGGVTKFIPHTGVTLPLVSYGGSSILSTILTFAVIQGIYLLMRKEESRIAR